MPTRGQVKRALEWLEWYEARKDKRRRPDPPRCVTCGGEADGEFRPGQPRYSCEHEPMRIDDDTMRRARGEWPRESEAV